MDDKHLDITKTVPTASTNPLTAARYVSPYDKLANKIENRRLETRQEGKKSVLSRRTNRESGRSGHVQEGKDNFELKRRESNQVFNAIHVFATKSPIKSIRNTVKNKRPAIDSSGDQGHKDSNYTLKLDQNEQKIIGKKYNTNERHTSNEQSSSFSTSPLSQVKSFSSPENSSQSLESSRKTAEKERVRSLHSHKLIKETETLVSGDMIPERYVTMKRRMNKITEDDSVTKKHKSFDFASGERLKVKPGILYDQDCNQGETGRCNCSRPSTSKSACCSYESRAIQGHPMNSIQELLLVCEHCGRHFLGRSNTEMKRFSCEKCTKRLASSYGVQIRMGTEEKSFDCKVCEKIFATPDELSMHYKTHTVDKPFKCRKCSEAFFDQRLFEIHHRIHAGNKPFKCNECGKAFLGFSNLQQHKKSHKICKPYQCKHCNKAFTQFCHFQQHSWIHTGYKPYKCKQCGKEFHRILNLEQHVKSHTAHKPYQCEHCDKAFTIFCHFQQHCWIHTGYNPYKCKQCDKEFNKLSKLNQHNRIHTGERPYVCAICGNSFILKDDRNRHVRIMHGEKTRKNKSLKLFKIHFRNK